MSSHTVLYVGTTALCKAEKDGQTISTETEFHMEYVNISINCSSSFLLDVVQSRNRNLWLSGYVTKQTVRMCVGVILLLYMFHRHITCLHAGCLSKSKPGILIFSEEAADKLSFTDLFSKNKLINTENRRDSADLVSVSVWTCQVITVLSGGRRDFGFPQWKSQLEYKRQKKDWVRKHLFLLCTRSPWTQKLKERSELQQPRCFSVGNIQWGSFRFCCMLC